MKFMAALRDSEVNFHHWANLSHNSSANSPSKIANSSAIAEEKGWEEEGKNFEDFEPAKKRKSITGSVTDFKQESVKNGTKSRDSEDSNPNLRIKPGERSKTYFFFLLENISESKST